MWGKCGSAEPKKMEVYFWLLQQRTAKKHNFSVFLLLAAAPL